MSMDESHFIAALRSRLPELNGLPGDRIMVRPGHTNPVVLIRYPAGDFGVIADALIAGDLEPLDTETSTAELVRLLRALAPPPPIDANLALALLQQPPEGYVPPTEPYGGCLLNGREAGVAWLKRQFRREDARTCRKCGAEFEPGPRRRVRCPECLAKARQRKRGSR